MLNILLIGSGGREHAIAWKIKQSSKLNNLFIAPGNAGTAELGENIPVEVTDFAGLKRTILEKKIDLVVVGPKYSRKLVQEALESQTVLFDGSGKTG